MISDTTVSVAGAGRDRLRGLQDERFVETVRRAYDNVPFYREAFEEAGISPSEVSGVDDIDRFPFTTKEDFRDQYPDGLFAVNDGAIEQVHASSGTTGKPKVVAYTDSDLDIWREVMGRTLDLAGVDDDDRLQNAFGYGLFTGGLGVHHGTDALGADVVPTGGGASRRQIRFLRDLSADAIAATPSYALRLIDVAEEMGVDLAELPVETVVYGAETCTEPMREAIEDGFGATAVDIYGLSELIGPGVACERRAAQDGLHVFEDHFYPEVVDPETGEPVDVGEEGELVLTSLTKAALPVVRYRTGDLTRLRADECECGRAFVRMDSVKARTDDMYTVRGINFYPTEIESVAVGTDGIAPHYRIDIDRQDSLDRLRLTIEAAREFDGDESALRDRLVDRLRNVLAFEPDAVDVVPYGTLDRSDGGKAQRVFDARAEP